MRHRNALPLRRYPKPVPVADETKKEKSNRTTRNRHHEMDAVRPDSLFRFRERLPRSEHIHQHVAEALGEVPRQHVAKELVHAKRNNRAGRAPAVDVEEHPNR